MKTIFKFALLTLMGSATWMPGFAAENLERGIVGPIGSNTSWAGFSIVSEVPGAGLIPITAPNTVFYIGFTAGLHADISHMVLYTTKRASPTITAVTPLKLGGISNPAIDLTNPAVCPVVEISKNNPCIVRLDPTPIRLLALSDYYVVVYFTSSDSNNSSLGVTVPAFTQSSLRGSYTSGDQTQLAVGASVPSLSFSGAPYLLMYVMND